MKSAKLFSLLVFPALVAYGCLGFYFLPQASFQGDLTRMAMLPESQFGWRKPQPQIAPELFQQSSFQDADVLVIGDSFSVSRDPGGHIWAWQTELVRHGLKVRTERWNNISGICSDFLPWLRAQGFKGKYVVIESVERYLMKHLNDSTTCKMQYDLDSAADIVPLPPITSYDTKGDYSGKLSIAFPTELNRLKYARLSQSPDFNSWILANGAKMVRVPGGCKLFSHAHCNDALFFSGDQAQEVDASALDLIESVNSHLTGITPIWAIVPNKSTVYLYPGKKFWDQAEQRIHSPNLLRMTQRAIKDGVVDLYPANNTHLSTSGFLLMGDEIYKTMLQTQALEKSPRKSN